MLRVIDLGRCTARDYFAASDVPALSTDETPILVSGIIAEDSLCLGFNRRWDKTLTDLPDGFARARFTTEGGIMYCRNVCVMRLWMPEPRADPFDLQSLLTNAAADELEASVDREISIDYETKYACVSGQKFAGGSHNLINGKSSGLIMINVGPTDFASVRHLFKTKRLLAVRDLAEFGLPPSYCDGVVARVAAEAECKLARSLWTPGETQIFERLREAHSDPRWIEDEAKMDLFDFRSFYDFDVYA